jgi:3-isopropylmalate dehydrogenase
MRNSAFEIAVMPGDGIGVEVMEAGLAVLDALQKRRGGFALALRTIDAGADCCRRTGTAFSDEAMKLGAAADAILFGAMGLPDVRYPDGTEIAPQLDIREKLELFAGVRPIRAIPGLPLPLADPRARDIDLVILREQTEGMFFARKSGTVEGDVARDTIQITRPASERLFDFALRLAAKRKRRCTVVDKANVFRSMAFFRSIFDERAARFPDVAADHLYIDAAALKLVQSPWSYDVMVTENQFGDILSDLGAAIVGGMGLAPSGDIGERHAMFQPCHGSAPDIAGTGKANPTAMILSAAMMLEWLGERHGNEKAVEAGAHLAGAVDAAFAGGTLRPCELGGKAGTAEIARAVIERL